MSDVPWVLLGVAALFPIVLSVLYMRHVFDVLRGRRRWVAAALLGVTLVGVAAVVWSVLVPGAQLAHAELELGQHLTAQLGVNRSAVLVRGELPHTDPGNNVEGTFRLEVTAPEADRLSFDGVLDKHYEQGRAGRRGKSETLVANLEERFDLPDVLDGKTVTVTVARKSDQIQGPLSLDVIPAPLDSQNVAIAGMAVALAAAVIDGLSERKSWLTPVLGTLAMYGVLVCHHVVPHGTFRPLVGAAMAAVAVGMSAGSLLRALSLKVLHREKPAAA